MSAEKTFHDGGLLCMKSFSFVEVIFSWIDNFSVTWILILFPGFASMNDEWLYNLFLGCKYFVSNEIYENCASTNSNDFTVPVTVFSE